MRFNLEDLSDMIAGLLTIYEGGIYMPHDKIFDGEPAALIANVDDINDSFLMYQNGDNIVFNGLNYPYINDFMMYLNNNHDEYMSMGDTIRNFLNLNYEKPKRKIKL